jgi:5-formyltetrahydrofolate cyclo-ligase
VVARVSSQGEDENGTGGSAPCLLHELGPDGALMPDAQQVRDITRWRKVERERLLALRAGLDVEFRAATTARMGAALDELLATLPDAQLARPLLISLYWPIRAEPDLRPWMKARAAGGTRIALPVATALGEPLTFREWHPGARMAHGLWRIPHPAEGPEVTPDVLLAPLVGFDAVGYRLGYGGGFFDRTLAVAQPRPHVIGVGYLCTAIRSIFPQPHDIAMDCIVTGEQPPLRSRWSRL